MDDGASLYLRNGIYQVEGWLSPLTAHMMASMSAHQSQLGVVGDFCEIGIHHGKSFFAVAGTLQSDETGIAVDVFDEQHKNVDGSGNGSLDIFLSHKESFAPHVKLEIIKESSLDLPKLGFVEKYRDRIRFFSIDGSHTRAATLNDLRLAERTLRNGGVVALDDVLSPHWLGVMSGLSDYLSSGGTLQPVALAPNKLILADRTRSETWKGFLTAQYGEYVTKQNVELFDRPVDVFDAASIEAKEELESENAGLRLTQQALDREISSLKRALVAAKLKQNDLRHENEAGNQEQEAVNRTLGAVSQRLAAVSHRLEAVSQELEAVYRSRSWRMTALPRKFASLLRH